MKKSVVVLIAIIYVAAIGLVSFFGLQFKVFEEIVPVEKIEILNTGLKVDSKGQNYVVISPDKDGNRRFQIEYRVYPDNATDITVRFTAETTPDGCATVDETGLVVFSKPGVAKVFLVAADGTNAEATITIISK